MPSWINKHSVIGFILGAIISPLVISLGLYFYVQSQMQQAELGPPDLPVEKPAPLDWQAQTLEGERFILEKKFDDQILFLNFWASWCGPCVAEMPSMERLYQKFQGRIKFACLSQEDPADIKAFQKEKGYTIPLYHYTDTPPEEFNTRGIPASFIISARGTIKLKHLGGADWAHEDVVAFLETLLAEAAGGNPAE